MKKSILFLLMLFTTFCSAQQEQETKDLKAALKAANEKNEDALVYNLRLFSARIDEQNITPEKLSKENLDLYTEALYIATVNQLSIPNDLGKNAMIFLNYNIEEKPYNMFALGVFYYNGFGIPKDNVKAIFWFEKAANQGIGLAMSNLGIIYATIDDYDYNKSIYWFEKAADKIPKEFNNIHMEILAQLYRILENYPKAIYWMERAIENGYDITKDTEKMQKLADMYSNFRAREYKDYTKARYWYEKAVALGNKSAMFSLGHMYWRGKGVEQNLELARYYLEKNCDCTYRKITKTTLKR